MIFKFATTDGFIMNQNGPELLLSNQELGNSFFLNESTCIIVDRVTINDYSHLKPTTISTFIKQIKSELNINSITIIVPRFYKNIFKQAYLEELLLKITNNIHFI